MGKILLLGMALTLAGCATGWSRINKLDYSSSRAEIVEKFGEPKGSFHNNGSEYLLYDWNSEGFKTEEFALILRNGYFVKGDTSRRLSGEEGAYVWPTPAQKAAIAHGLQGISESLTTFTNQLSHGNPCRPGDVFVTAYRGQDGRWVESHCRTPANNTVNDNYSTQGNYNPYTGTWGTRPRQ